MALTRKYLKTLGVDAEAIDQIIEAHTDTVDALKRERDEAKEQAEKLADVTRERDELQARVQEMEKSGGNVKKEFDEYKARIEAEKLAEKQRASVRKALEAEKADPRVIELLLQSVDMSRAEMDGDNVKNAADLVKPVRERYPDSFGVESIGGIARRAPLSGGSKTMTREEIAAIKDQGARQKAIAQNMQLFE